MANILEKAIWIIAGNLNSGLVISLKLYLQLSVKDEGTLGIIDEKKCNFQATY